MIPRGFSIGFQAPRAPITTQKISKKRFFILVPPLSAHLIPESVFPKPLCVWASFSNTPEQEESNTGKSKKRRGQQTRLLLLLFPPWCWFCSFFGTPPYLVHHHISMFRLKIDENSTIFHDSRSKKIQNYIPDNLALSPEPNSIKKGSKNLIY